MVSCHNRGLDGKVSFHWSVLFSDTQNSQGWWLNLFPGQCLRIGEAFLHPFGEEISILNIESIPLQAQLEAVSSNPVSCYLGEETNIHMATTSFQIVLDSDKVPSETPSLQIKHP